MRFVLLFALAACASPTAPGVAPLDAREFSPPASYVDTASTLLACAGDPRDPAALVASTRWFVVSGFDDQRDGLRFTLTGLWRPGVGIYLRDPEALGIVAHELNHLRLGGDDRHADASWGCV